MYRELRVVTARPTQEEEAQAPHKLYGMLPASESCSAGKWLNLARMEIDWALSQGSVPVVVGGTGLYIRALMQGIADIPDIDPQVRQQVRQDFDAMGNAAFHERLAHVDPALGEKLRVSDSQRLIRAYEVWLGTGKALSWWQAQGTKPVYPIDKFVIFNIEVPRPELYNRCNTRFITMLEQGAVNEVKSLMGLGLSPELPAMKSVGVPELSAYLRGDMTLEAATEAAQQATRNYAKRQLTWFRHQLLPHHSITNAQDVKIAELLTY
jgi:tRNA dimethylallyltransferase